MFNFVEVLFFLLGPYFHRSVGRSVWLARKQAYERTLTRDCEGLPRTTRSSGSTVRVKKKDNTGSFVYGLFLLFILDLNHPEAPPRAGDMAGGKLTILELT